MSHFQDQSFPLGSLLLGCLPAGPKVELAKCTSVLKGKISVSARLQNGSDADCMPAAYFMNVGMNICD